MENDKPKLIIDFVEPAYIKITLNETTEFMTIYQFSKLMESSANFLSQLISKFGGMPLTKYDDDYMDLKNDKGWVLG